MLDPLANETLDSQYHVGRDIPTVPFKVPESWSGLMPISPSGSTDKEYFFWLYPSQTKAGSDDLIIWNNGGPGCSSLEGLLQELGPYVFPFRGPAYPNEPYVRPNPYSWTNLSSVVFTEQPVGGTGFTQGIPSVKNEIDVANDFYGFLVNFFETFPELKGKRLWLAGESYAGKYIPYMASKIYNSTETNKKHGINLQGIAINDPSFTGDFFGEEAASIEFAHRFKDDMLLSDAFLSKIDADAAQHNFTNFVKKNLVYPPPAGGIQVPAAYAADANYDPCKWSLIFLAQDTH
jgi:carboxypeptidase D